MSLLGSSILNVSDVKKFFHQSQNKYMWQVVIPYIPFIGSGIELTYLTRLTGLPTIERESTKITLPNGKIYTVPNKSVPENDWSITVALTEDDTILKKLQSWYNIIDYNDLLSFKTVGSVNLLNFAGKHITKAYILDGIYPLNIPTPDSLDQSLSNENIELVLKFAIDGILPF